MSSESASPERDRSTDCTSTEVSFDLDTTANDLFNSAKRALNVIAALKHALVAEGAIENESDDPFKLSEFQAKYKIGNTDYEVYWSSTDNGCLRLVRSIPHPLTKSRNVYTLHETLAIDLPHDFDESHINGRIYYLKVVKGRHPVTYTDDQQAYLSGQGFLQTMCKQEFEI